VLAAGSRVYATLAALQFFGWVLGIVGLRFRTVYFNSIVAPASALLALNAAAVVALYRFLFTRGPLWKIWGSSKPGATSPTPETENSAQREPVAAHSIIDIGK